MISLNIAPSLTTEGVVATEKLARAVRWILGLVVLVVLLGAPLTGE